MSKSLNKNKIEVVVKEIIEVVNKHNLNFGQMYAIIRVVDDNLRQNSEEYQRICNLYEALNNQKEEKFNYIG